MRAEAQIDLRGSDEPVYRRRTSKEIVMRAAIDIIARDGVDHVSASDVVTAAGVSRSTLYAYFGDAHGIFAEIWATAGAEWLRGLASRPLAMNPGLDSFDAAMFDLFVVAARLPELRELVLPDVESLMRTVAGNPVAEARLLWTLAVTVGVPLSVPVTPESFVVADLAALAVAIPDDAAVRLGLDAADALVAPPVSSVLPASSDDTTDRILRASVKVVGDSGHRAASMMRVCRVARLTVGAAAPLFSSLVDLHDRAFAGMLNNVVAESTRQIELLAATTSSADMYAMFNRSLAHESRMMWRRYRHELYVAARTNPELAAKMRVAFRAVNESFGRTLAAAADIDPSLSDKLILINHALSVGMAYLVELGLPVATIDHRIATRWLWSAIDAPE